MSLAFFGLLGCVPLADTAIAIQEVCLPQVSSLRPKEGSEQLPLDARLLVVAEQSNPDCSDASVEFTLSLDGEVLETGSGDARASVGLVEIVPESPFEADRTYDLTVEDLLTEQFFETSFTTGTAEAPVLDWPPFVTIDALTLEEGDRRSDEFLWNAVLTIEHEPAFLDLSLLHLSGGESITDSHGAVFANSDGLVTLDVPFWTTERNGDACFQVAQEDETGRGGEASQIVCQELPQVPLGCSSTGAPPKAAAWLLLPLLSLVRRQC